MKHDMIPVEGNAGLFRNSSSNGIVNNDIASYQAIKRIKQKKISDIDDMRNMKIQICKLEDRCKILEEEISRIKLINKL